LRRLAAVFVFVTLVFGKPIVNGDGVQYYAYARSTIVDRDLHFANEYAEALPRFRSLAPRPARTSRGFDEAYAPVGAAVVWMPPLAAAHAGTIVVNHAGGHAEADGYSTLDMFVAALTSWLLMLLGLLLCFDLARQWVAPRAALVGVLGGWLATPLFANAYELPMFAHAVDFGLVASLVWLTVRGGATLDWRRWLIIGVLFGFCVATRQQNVTVALLPVAAWLRLWRDRRADRRSILVAGGCASIGALIGFLPQIAMNLSLFGRPLAIHLQYVPRVDWPPHLWRDLFSRAHGLFSWTPLAAIAIVFLAIAARRPERRLTALVGLAVFASNVLLIGVLPYGPVLIGQRYLINCTPFFMLGLAAAAESLGVDRQNSRWRIALVALALFVLWNINLETLVVYGQIAGDGRFTVGELVWKQLAVAPRYWIRHVSGLSINQPCFSPLRALWDGAGGRVGPAIAGTAAILALVAGARLTTAIADAIIGWADGRSSRAQLTHTIAFVAAVLPVVVAGVWIWLGAPFDVFR
jgi:hypothetical protein